VGQLSEGDGQKNLLSLMEWDSGLYTRSDGRSVLGDVWEEVFEEAFPLEISGRYRSEDSVCSETAGEVE
jgi:hypothetical protein